MARFKYALMVGLVALVALAVVITAVFLGSAVAPRARLGNTVAPAPAADPKADVAWAKRIVTNFLYALAADNGDMTSPAALGLLSPEYLDAVKQDCDMQHGSKYLGLIRSHGYGPPAFTSEEVAPNGNEVVFSGTLKHPGDDDLFFTARVVREREKEIWSIRYFHYFYCIAPNRFGGKRLWFVLVMDDISVHAFKTFAFSVENRHRGPRRVCGPLLGWKTPLHNGRQEFLAANKLHRSINDTVELIVLRQVDRAGIEPAT